MLLENIITLLEALEEEPGTFVGMRYTPDSVRVLEKIQKAWAAPNPLAVEKFHVTVAFSKGKVLDKFVPRGKIDTPIKVTVVGPKIFEARSGEKVLVVVLESKDLQERHSYTNDEHGANYDFEEYIPHTTVSYDCGEDFDISNLKSFEGVVLELDEEYCEPIAAEWASKD